MGILSVLNNMIENKLRALHTAYLAKVLSVSGNTAKIQPLGYVKAYGEAAQKQSPLSNVPIATQKIVNETIEVVDKVSLELEKDGDNVTDVKLNITNKTVTIPQVESISAGDIVICVCCERDITQAKNGNNTVPAIGHHSMSDSVIVGVL